MQKIKKNDSSPEKSYFKYIDLFAGIGGFHEAAKKLNGKCVFACEIEKNARAVYVANHRINKKAFPTDIKKINPNDIPEHDILMAGFPCQPFSQSGFKKGFEDERGNLFFDIERIIKAKNPKAFFLENVRHLLKHDSGNTFGVIYKRLDKLGYKVSYKVVRASDFGLPQHRPRVFIVGIKKSIKSNFEFPQPIPLKLTLSDVFEGKCNREIGFTLRVGGKNCRLEDRRNWDGYLVDGKLHRLTSKEGLQLMGFPKNFKLDVSSSTAMKLLGNSVAVPAVRMTMKSILNTIQQ